MVTRAQIQEKLNDLKDLYPERDLGYIKIKIGEWFDTFELGNEIFSHEQMRQRLLDDLNSYEGGDIG